MLLGFPTKCFMIIQIRVLTPSRIHLPMRLSKMGVLSSSFWIAFLISSLDPSIRQLFHHCKSLLMNPKVMSSMTFVWGWLSFSQLLATIVICWILFGISCSDKPSMFHSQSLPKDTKNWLVTFLSSNQSSGGVGYQFLVRLVGVG